ncbi:hypothetical protein QE152_g35021 [Popillia japonica]|uniref:Uncharacterized protein n=1 Tax=Popillia japonica TaxID=7064 RepID=A0AAW1IS45_POPJA
MVENEFEEWMAIDQSVEVAAQLTDDDICETVTTSEPIKGGTEDSDCEEYCSVEKLLSNVQMRHALEVLRKEYKQDPSNLKSIIIKILLIIYSEKTKDNQLLVYTYARRIFF